MFGHEWCQDFMEKNRAKKTPLNVIKTVSVFTTLLQILIN
jgi:hypothetical protein